MASDTDQPCKACGALPTAKVKFMKEQGLGIARRSWWASGYYCRDCGLQIFEEYQSFLKARGWWHIAGPIRNPLFLMMNSSNAKKLRVLGPPMRSQAQIPA